MALKISCPKCKKEKLPDSEIHKLKEGQKVNFMKNNGEMVVAVWLNRRDWLVGCLLLTDCNNDKLFALGYDGYITSIIGENK